MAEAVADLGHNNPPTDIEILKDRLDTENAALAKRRDELLDAATRVPPSVDTEEMAGKVSDFLKQVSACMKNAEAQRESAKEPHLAAGRVVDGYFKTGFTNPLDTAKRAIQDRLTTYLRKKEEAERRRREEEERKAREAAAEAEARARAAAEQMRSAADMATAISAEEEAVQKAADALKAEQDANAKAAELSRTRGDFGALASLKTEWVGEVDNVTGMTFVTLAPYIAKDAIEKALRLAIRNGVREVAGCRIFERKTATVR